MTETASPEDDSLRSHSKAIGVAIERSETVIAVAAAVYALWQLVRIDLSLAATAVFFAAFPLAAVIVTLRKVSTLARSTATLYLLLLAVGAWIADVTWLPGFTGLHRGSTEFADLFNRLDLRSRRLITWNGALSCAYCFYGVGHMLFITQLRRDPPDIPRATCFLSLAILWGVSALVLLLSVIGLVRAYLHPEP